MGVIVASAAALAPVLLSIVAIELGTTIWVGVDAANLRRRKLDSKPAWLWVIECLCIWTICFPWYLVHRHHVLERARLRSAVTVPAPMATAAPSPSWPPPPPPGWVPSSYSVGGVSGAPPPVPPPPYAPGAYGSPAGASPWGPQMPATRPTSTFPWWLIVMLVVGCVLFFLATAGLFADNHLRTVGHLTVNCGSVVFPRNGSAQDASGVTCTTNTSNLLIGDIIIFVLSACLIGATFLIWRARVRRAGARA